MSLLIGFLFGFVGSIPIAGPISLLVFAYGVSGKLRSGLFLAMGGALAEGVYAYLAFWGLNRLLERYPAIVAQTRGVGAVVIFSLGLAFLLKKTKQGEEIEERSGRGGSFLLGVTITALNPTLIVTWSAAVTTLYSTGYIAPGDAGSAVAFAASACVGIVCWFASLLLLLNRFKGRFTRQSLDKLVRAVGCVLIALSLWFAVSFIRYLFEEGA